MRLRTVTALLGLGLLLAALPAVSTAARPLRVLVSNDDGVKAPGIDAVVQALSARPDIAVTVVAPLQNQSGTGGKVTPGPAGKLKATATRTASGHRAIAVAGFPADSVRYALAKVVKPAKVDLVVSGINDGANVGPFVDISGTVGAARAAAQQGIPALATSQGSSTTKDFTGSVAQTMAWVDAHRGSLKRGTVQNLNVPTCSTGTVRGTVSVLSGTGASFPRGVSPLLGPVDCTQTGPAGPDDVTAYLAGYAGLTKIAKLPKTAPR
jgi:5'-nucleotidase